MTRTIWSDSFILPSEPAPTPFRPRWPSLSSAAGPIEQVQEFSKTVRVHYYSPSAQTMYSVIRIEKCKRTGECTQSMTRVKKITKEDLIVDYFNLNLVIIIIPLYRVIYQ